MFGSSNFFLIVKGQHSIWNYNYLNTRSSFYWLIIRILGIMFFFIWLLYVHTYVFEMFGSSNFFLIVKGQLSSFLLRSFYFSVLMIPWVQSVSIIVFPCIYKACWEKSDRNTFLSESIGPKIIFFGGKDCHYHCQVFSLSLRCSMLYLEGWISC